MENSSMRIVRLGAMAAGLLATTVAYAQITPLGDSYINTGAPTANYGAKTLLDVDAATQVTYIQFNLASIPTSASVSQATLKLYVNSVTTAGSFNVDFVNGSWTEGTIDASNAPAPGAAIASNVTIGSADKNQYILVDVTSAVQAWMNGQEANDGLALVANGSFNATFDSKENTTTSHPAELDIAFAGGSGTITGVTTASGSGLVGGGTSGTLNLSLTNGCAANQVLEWNGSAWACANVGTGTITGVTAGTDLTGGGTGGNVTLNLNTAATDARYAQLAAANTFTGNQTVSGNLSATGVVTGNSFNIGHNLFAYGDPNFNTFLGFFAGNIAMTGQLNTGTGFGALSSNTTGQANSAVGEAALNLNTTGTNNTASGAVALSSNTTGNNNTASGAGALQFNTTGTGNSASGSFALQSNTTGSQNTASGHEALEANSTGNANTAEGYHALSANSTAAYNTAIGWEALTANTGQGNTATGAQTLFFNTTGIDNEASGAGALYSNTTGGNNTASGYSALGGNTTGSNNVAVGVVALGSSSTGCCNVAVGASALDSVSTGVANTGVGNVAGKTADSSGITGKNNTFLGTGTALGTGTLTNATALGANAEVDASNTLILGSINGVNGQTVTVNVGIGTTKPDNNLTVNGSADKPGGGSWGTYSDRRLKTVDGNYNYGLSQILKINPVRYRYKPDNAMGIRDTDEHVGLVAQEVQKVIPAAVTENSSGYLLVNNDPIIWTMLNAVKEQQKEIAALRKQAAKLASTVARLKQERDQVKRIASARMTP